METLLSDLSGQAREESHVLGQIIPSSFCVQGMRVILSSGAGPTGLSGKEILLGSPSSHKLFVADTMQP